MLSKMYYLVANPEDRVSREVAHFQMVYQFIAVHQSNRVTLYKKKFKLRNEQQRNKWKHAFKFYTGEFCKQHTMFYEKISKEKDKR